VWLFGVAVERDEPGVIVDTLGINGSRARYQLLWDDQIYREHLRRRDPDLVVLAYGTNESGDDSPIEDYERDLRAVVERIRETVPKASCLLIGPSDRPMQVEERVFEDRARTADLIAVQHRVALEYGCGFFDLVAFQGGALSMVQWAASDPPYASQDHIHYTRLGYQRLGEVLLSALLEGMSTSGETDAGAGVRASADAGVAEEFLTK
jgi:lysophospholipase L1-like esterase